MKDGQNFRGCFWEDKRENRTEQSLRAKEDKAGDGE